MATIWLAGESAVEQIAAAFRKVPGFGGKGFRTLRLRGVQGASLLAHCVGVPAARSHITSRRYERDRLGPRRGRKDR